MNDYKEIPVIGYTIAIGNPSEGFGLYGFFESKDAAIAATEQDRTIGPDWWLMPVYMQEPHQ